jgi:hypothetical protein
VCCLQYNGRQLTEAAPTTKRAVGVALWRTWVDRDLIPDGHYPLVLQQLRRRRSFLGIANEAFLQKVDARWAELVGARELWRVALCNVVHDSPLVVERGPRSTASSHLENNAAQRPYVHGPIPAWILTFYDFRGHVHWSASNILLGFSHRGIRNEGFALASDDFCCAEVDIFNDTAVIEENVCAS